MRTIPLSQGYVAFVDDQDFERVSQFKWHVERMKSGKIYVQTTYVRNRYITSMRLHRFIMGCTEGDGMVVDHKNGDGLDNRRENLRVCTQSQNCMNQRPQTKKKSSRFKGVGWHKKQKAWRAYIRFADHQVHFGPFKTEVDAAGAYNVAALIFFGDFAHLNRI